MRRSAVVAILAVGLLLGSCSKTQDTAPETRLFGTPPVIQNVTLSTSGLGTATCDFSKVLEGTFCDVGFALASHPEAEITVNFTEMNFAVQASDPDTKTGGQNDILLVSASYVKSNQGNPVETSIVLLDDGKSNHFNFQQQGTDFFEDCRQEQFAACSSPGLHCQTANYDLTSNDPIANDGIFSRGFALTSGRWLLTEPADVNLGSTKTALGANCIALAKAQFPVIADVGIGQPVNFKIEVVDRAGNLTTWPVRPEAVFSQTTLSCTGDACGCCFLMSGDPKADCVDKEGMHGAPGTPFEDGACHHLDLF
jgi:hypothetical protein